jgi:serine/threonine protein kinase/tetratricopeptide (TPR) repeat protein
VVTPADRVLPGYIIPRMESPDPTLEHALSSSYRLTRELGRGGMAVVYLAHDTKHDRSVALKVIRPDIDFVGAAERFSREIKIAARLQHPHILPVFDSGVAAGQLWYTMPYVEGESLRDRLDREGRLPIAEAVRIAREAAQALAHAHQHAVIHRDIKPENLLLTADRSVLVADFGIARAIAGPTSTTSTASTALTETGVSIGTPAYMAPETRLGAPADARSDTYSLAAVLYEMLTGKMVAGAGGLAFDLFMPDTMPLLRAQRVEIPEQLDALVRKGLQLHPEQRFTTMEDFARALAETSPFPGSRKRGLGVGLSLLIVAMLAVAAVWAFRSRTDATASPDNQSASIAVLPFHAPSGDTAQQYFAEGIADELTTALVRFTDIRVASQSGVARLPADDATPTRAGQVLGVASVLEGTVRRQGDRIRVNVQLTRAADGFVLWAERYDREMRDVFQVQDEITQAIVSALEGTLHGGDGTTGKGTSNLSAYDLYLRGRYFWSKRGEEGTTKAIDYFSQATRADSGFARAAAGLSMAYAVLPVFSPANPDSLLELAAGHAHRALALDSSLPDAHLALAYVLKSRWQFAESEREFRAALALAPNDPVVHHWYGVLLYATGRIDESINQMEEARRLDPFGSTIASDGAVALYSAGRFAAAQAEVRRGLALDSAKSDTPLIQGWIYLGEGKGDSAIAALNRARELGTGFDIRPYLSVAHRLGGNLPEAQRLYRELQQDGRNPLGTAIAGTAAGDTSVALAALHDVFQDQEVLATELSIPCDPLLRSLHSSLAFVVLLREAGMVECRVS